MELSQMTNFQLEACIKNIAKGDKSALYSLYENLKTPIFRFALSVVKNYQQAEDIMQSSFINIMTYAKTYHGGTNPKAWIFTIVKNLCITYIKKNGGEDRLYDYEATLESGSYAGMQAFDETAEALGALSADELEIVSLYVFGGLKQTEIAKTLKLPYIKVRSKYGYAMKKLKEYYLSKE